MMRDADGHAAARYAVAAGDALRADTQTIKARCTMPRAMMLRAPRDARARVAARSVARRDDAYAFRLMLYTYAPL